MKDVTLTVNKAIVYDEVAKTTSYAGAKKTGDPEAYDRIFTTDDDREMLERFWMDACNIATDRLKPFLVSVDPQPKSHGVELGRNYIVKLKLSSAFEDALKESIETSLFGFFVSMIVCKWYKFTNKEDQDNDAAEALSLMQDVLRKLYFKKKPIRIYARQD